MVKDNYTPPLLHRSSLLATILPNVLRPVATIAWTLEEHRTTDDDVFVSGSLKQGSSTCVVLLHGLEGSIHSRYMLGMAHELYREGKDIIALNHRGCGGQDNLQPSSYHSGFTQDLSQLLASLENRYEKVWLIGFSLGGNIALKYVLDEDFPSQLSGVIAISAPIDLAGSSARLDTTQNWIYEQRFLRSLKRKAAQKKAQHPTSDFNLEAVHAASTIQAFDDAYTARINGFKDARDYYQQCSTYKTLKEINLPTLLINAQNDSFLSPNCFPQAEKSLHVLRPRFGGHVGFARDHLMRKQFWHEVKAKEFIKTFTP